MTTHPIDAEAEQPSLTGSNRRTLDAIFEHPLAHNLGWSDVVALLRKIGDVEDRTDGGVSLKMGGKHHAMPKPRAKDLEAEQLMGLRRFLVQAGWASGLPPEPAATPDPGKPVLMVVVDHHGAKIFQIDISSGDASAHVIRPYDPHHFLHHLAHKDQDRERGQRAPEDHGFYEQIADALISAGQIILVGHGTGKSSASAHLSEYLRTHRNGIYRHVVDEVVADLSSITTPQLLQLAQQASRR